MRNRAREPVIVCGIGITSLLILIGVTLRLLFKREKKRQKRREEKRRKENVEKGKKKGKPTGEEPRVRVYEGGGGEIKAEPGEKASFEIE